MTRRDFSKMAIGAPLGASLASVAAAAKVNSTFNGVAIGAQTYSFREMPLDGCIAAMREIGIGFAELYNGHIEPKDPKLLDAWRSNPPLEEMKNVRKKFEQAGIELYALNYSFRDSFSDQQIDAGFQIAKAMGLNKITASSNVDVSERVDKFARQYKTFVGFHNHDSMKPNEFSTPDDWKTALAGRSKYIGINLDIGHFTAANFDPLSFLEEHHAQIVTLHLKDRKKNHGPNVPWGEGDTNIKGVLDLLRTKKYPIPAMIEYEYGKPGTDTVANVTKCFEYVKQALAG